MSNPGLRASPPAGPLRALRAYLGRGLLANRRDTRAVLMARIAVLNLIAAAMVLAAWAEGWVAKVVAADPDHLCAGIAAVFAAGLLLALRAAWRIGADLDAAHAGTLKPGQTAGLERRLRARLGPVRHIANTLVILGLLGTVVGFIIALGGVRPDAAADIRAVGPMISTLITGMSVALYTTLVGAVLNIWLMANYRMLLTAGEKLMAAVGR